MLPRYDICERKGKIRSSCEAEKRHLQLVLTHYGFCKQKSEISSWQMHEVEKPHLLLLLLRYGFRKWKSKIRSDRPTWSCCSHDTVFASEKVKTGQKGLAHLQLLLPRYSFRTQKSETGQKAPLAAATPTIKFLRAKKWKQVRIDETEKAYLQLLLPR